MKRHRRTSGPVAVAALLAALALAGCVGSPDPPANDAEPESAPDAARAFGETHLVFEPPAPWYVEGVTLHGDELFAGTALGLAGSFFPTQTFGEPSRIYAVNATSGELLDTILVEGEDTTAVHGVTGLEMDGDGRLYAGSIQAGVLRFTRAGDGWTQELYAALPDLPMCSPLASAPCSPTPDDDVGLANDLTFDAQGNLYVTDSYQATIWRIPPGPGEPEVWYQHASIDRMFGPNGLRISPEGDRMFLAVCCPDTAIVGLVDRASKIVTMPFPDPGNGAPTDFAILDNGEGADGIAFGERGDLYVASNFGNKIFVFSPDGTPARTITNADLSGEGELDFPASLVFHDRSLVITNYAWFDAVEAASDTRSVIEVYVDDAGIPEARPTVP